MTRNLIITVIFIFIPSLCISQNDKPKWGISAPVLSTNPSTDIAFSRGINESNMVLFWARLYYYKNDDVTPNQDVFENLIWSIETEFRHNLYIKNKVDTGFVERHF